MTLVRGQSTFEGLLIDWVLDHRGAPTRLPVEWLSREQKAAELQRLQAEKAMRAAYEAELIVGLAEDSPELPGDHPAAGSASWAPEGVLPGVDESFTHELSVILNCGRRSASIRAARAWVFRENLPGTRAALAAGELDEPRALALVDVLEAAAPEAARWVEAQLLPEAAELSVRRLRKRAIQLLLKKDAQAVDERQQLAERRADVSVCPSPRDGMATLAAELPAPVAAECYEFVDRLAQLRKADGDGRPIGLLRTEVLADLLRRPWQPGRAVAAHLTVTAALPALAGRSGEAGEVNGLPVTAGHLRALLAELDALRPDGLRAPEEGGSLVLALTEADGALRATATRAQLERLARRGCPAHPVEECACPLLDRPPATQAYQPTDAQRVWVRTRDRSCRFPNCGQRVGWADLDHVLAHARGGETSCTNLCCLCRSHHRLKTRRTDWHFEMSEDGLLTVTTPSGITRTTRPPGLRPPSTEPPEDVEPPEDGEPPEDVEPLEEREPTPPPDDPGADPPPF